MTVKSHNSFVGERKLWAAVLHGAINDAIGARIPGVHPMYQKATRLEAQRWFTEADQDFYTVCSFAGMEANAVRDRVIKMIEEQEKEAA